jgi:predicted Rossmann fold flavoprotein
LAQKDLNHTIVIGGGAAGFFTAINLAQRLKNQQITILERGKDVLQKVRISGGGRCNVTHAQFDPRELASNYPRGSKELLGPFHRFMTGDTIAWFEEQGVPLKTEPDGRMFPVSNTSQSIIDCFISLSRKHNINIRTSQNVVKITKNTHWKIETKTNTFKADHLVIAAGSSPKIWQLLQDLGHQIIPPVPSLFTFNVVDKAVTKLLGISALATVSIPSLKFDSHGPLLITHWGFSGPAILKLSAWCARQLYDLNYKFDIAINWLSNSSTADCYHQLIEQRSSKKLIINDVCYGLAKRLWQLLVSKAQISDKTWASCSNAELNKLASILTHDIYRINGKSTFKEEFVTSGGVHLKEVNFKTFESRLHKNLYLAGEVLNIDAITGGFNFQNAWTGGWIVAQSIKPIN